MSKQQKLHNLKAAAAAAAGLFAGTVAGHAAGNPNSVSPEDGDAKIETTYSAVSSHDDSKTADFNEWADFIEQRQQAAKDFIEQRRQSAKDFIEQKRQTAKEFLGQQKQLNGEQAREHRDIKASSVREQSEPRQVSSTAEATTKSDRPYAYFSPESLAYALSRVDVTPEQQQAFMDAYVDNMNKENRISPQGLIDAFEKAGFNKSTAQTFTDNLLTANKQLKEKNLAKADDSQSQKPEINPEDIHRIETPQGAIHYAFVENRMLKQYDLKVSMLGLIPYCHETNDGKYKCGPTVENSYKEAQQAESYKILNICINHFICKDLQEREANGEKLNADEKAFMEKHPAEMKEHGLYIDANGNFKQKNNMQNVLKQNLSRQRG